MQLWSGIDAGRSGEPAGLGYTRDATWLPSVDRLDPELTPHDLRHTWASWHYALNRDLLALKIEGGWSSVALVERYAHLLPAVQEPAIRQFLGWHCVDTDRAEAGTTS